ncbi:MAG: hypothetical protein ACREH5_00935, partial [Candidatus Omnitrophota bacterium]
VPFRDLEAIRGALEAAIGKKSEDWSAKNAAHRSFESFRRMVTFRLAERRPLFFGAAIQKWEEKASKVQSALDSYLDTHKGRFVRDFETRILMDRLNEAGSLPELAIHFLPGDSDFILPFDVLETQGGRFEGKKVASGILEFSLPAGARLAATGSPAAPPDVREPRGSRLAAASGPAEQEGLTLSAMVKTYLPFSRWGAVKKALQEFDDEERRQLRSRMNSLVNILVGAGVDTSRFLREVMPALVRSRLSYKGINEFLFFEIGDMTEKTSLGRVEDPTADILARVGRIAFQAPAPDNAVGLDWPKYFQTGLPEISKLFEKKEGQFYSMLNDALRVTTKETWEQVILRSDGNEQSKFVQEFFRIFGKRYPKDYKIFQRWMRTRPSDVEDPSGSRLAASPDEGGAILPGGINERERKKQRLEEKWKALESHLLRAALPIDAKFTIKRKVIQIKGDVIVVKKEESVEIGLKTEGQLPVIMEAGSIADLASELSGNGYIASVVDDPVSQSKVVHLPPLRRIKWSDSAQTIVKIIAEVTPNKLLRDVQGARLAATAEEQAYSHPLLQPGADDPIAKRFNEGDREYLAAMYAQYLTNVKKKTEPLTLGREVIGASMLYPDATRKKMMRLHRLNSILKDGENERWARERVHITKNVLDAGVGKGVVRQKYIETLYRLAKEGKIALKPWWQWENGILKPGAKGTDLHHRLVAPDGKPILISTAELKLLHNLKVAEDRKFARIVYRPIVSTDAQASYTTLFESEVYSGRQPGRTYRQWARGKGLEIAPDDQMLIIHDFPKVDNKSNDLTFQDPTMGGNHGQWGFEFLRRALVDPAPDDRYCQIEAFLNGDGPNNDMPPAVAGWMARENIPIAVIVTERTEIDAKGGVIGLKNLTPHLDVREPEAISHLKLFERKEAEEAEKAGRKGEIEKFENLGLPGGMGEA